MEPQYAPAGMSTGDAGEVTAILQSRLADLIDLSLTLKHVHWNVVGFGFIGVHKLMDEQTDAVRALVDEVAERITTLGAVAAGLPSQVVEERTSDADYALGRGPVMAHLGALDKVYERVISGHRDAISAVEQTDPVSEDLLISQTATLDLHHWFVRAHLSDTEGNLATLGNDSELDAAAASANLLQPAAEIEVAEESQDEPDAEEAQREPAQIT
jgi:starvation-inducible DNA-binding protein